MINRIIGKISIFILIVMNFGCSEVEDFSAERVTGTFHLGSVYKHGLTTSGHSFSEDITTECDLLTTLEIKSDGTFEQIEFTNEDCTKEIIRNGTWKVTRSIGELSCELKFNDSNVLYNLYETAKQPVGGGNALIIAFRIEYFDENPPENMSHIIYHHTFMRGY